MSLRAKKHFIKSSKLAFFCLVFGSFVLFLLFFLKSNKISAEITTPAGRPPEDNTPFYLNIGDDNQVKKGALRLGTDNISPPFNYQLEVVGEGAEFSNMEARNNLRVSNTLKAVCTENSECNTGEGEYCLNGYCQKDTLFVDSSNNRVCIGPCLGGADTKLEVSSGSFKINAGQNTGLSTVSSSGPGVSGRGSAYGIEGISLINDSSGILASSLAGVAVEGKNSAFNYSSIYGVSDAGYAVYGTNNSSLGEWAGYFNGRLETTKDLSGSKLLARNLSSSLVSYTSGQESGAYFTGYFPSRLASNGRYIWAGQSGSGHDEVIKVNKSTGKVLSVYGDLGPANDLVYDQANGYVWESTDTYPARINRIDVSTGQADIREVLDSDGNGTCPIFSLALDPNDSDIIWAIQQGGTCFGRDFHDRLLKLKVSDYSNSDSKWDPIARYNIIHSGEPNPPVTKDPVAMEYDSATDSLWIAFFSNGMVYKINALNPDGGDGQIDGLDYSSYSIPGPTDLSFDADNGYMWASSSSTTDGAYYIDVNAGTVSALISTYASSRGPQAIKYDGYYVWVATSNNRQGSVDRFIATNPSSIDHFSTSTGQLYNDILVESGYVWVTSDTTDGAAPTITSLDHDSGAVISNFNYSPTGYVARIFDGSNLWLTLGSKIYKMRTGDNFIYFDSNVGSGINDLMYDGQYIWAAVSESGNTAVKKIDQASGEVKCSLVLSDGDSPQGLIFDGNYYWAVKSGSLAAIKYDSNCQLVSTIDFSSTAVSLGKMIFDGSYVWTWGVSKDGSADSIFRINPSDDSVVGYTHPNFNGIVGLYFDNYYYWVVNSGNNTLVRYYYDADAGQPVVLSIHQTGDTPKDIVFDGMYFWVSNTGGKSISRILAADPDVKEDFNIGVEPTGLVFDGSYLWVSSSEGLFKYFTGQGYGTVNNSGILSLQNGDMLDSQAGNINISGSGVVGLDASVGDDLSAENNLWGSRESGDLIYSSSSVEWFASGSSFPNNGHDLNDFITDQGGNIYASGTSDSGATVFKSLDQGESWMNTGGPYAAGGGYSLLLAGNGDIYVGSGAGLSGSIYRSTDGGNSWNFIRNFNGIVYSIIEDENGYFYAATYDAGSGYVYKSTDGGNTWFNTGGLIGAGVVYDLLQLKTGQILAATGDANGDVFITDDRGVTWSNTGDLSGVITVRSLIQSSDNTIYASGKNASGQGVVFKSVDNGTTWSATAALPNLSMASALAEAVDGSILVGGSASGASPSLFRSVDGGASWIAQSGLPINSNITAIFDDGSFPLIKLLVGHTLGSLLSFGEYQALSPGQINCPDGHFVVNIGENPVGQINSLECRPL